MRPESILDAHLCAQFDRLVIVTDGCWLWSGVLNPHGYAVIWNPHPGAPKWVRAHRLSYERNIGPIGSGLSVCHSCDVRSCTNPAHLFLGSHAENMADAVTKVRFPVGEKHWRSRLTVKDVLDVRQRAARGERPSAIARIYAVSHSTISEIVHRVTWRHI